VPGGRAAVFEGDEADELLYPQIEAAIALPLARDLGDGVERGHEKDLFSLVYSGSLLGKLDAALVEQAVAAALPQSAREGLEVLAGPGSLSICLPGGLSDSLAADEVEQAITSVLVTQEVRSQFRLRRKNGRVTAIFGNAMLTELNAREMSQRVATCIAKVPGAGFEFVRTRGSFSAVGFRRVAILFALVAFVLLQLPVWLVRERFDSEAHTQEHVSLLRGYADALRNFPFVVYCLAFFLFTTGFIAVQNVLPYWAELGLGGDESTVSLLMIPFIIVCVLFFAAVPVLTRRLHTKWMTFVSFLIISTGMPWMYVIPQMDITVQAKTILGGLLFGYCGIGQSIMYVMMTPMLGEIIDFDEMRSGQRREALYNGLHGLASKIAIAFAIVLATQSMSRWGNSVVNPAGVFLVGPLAGGFGLLGMIAILFYPVLHVTRQHEAGQSG